MILFLLCLITFLHPGPDQPVELGRVHWLRSMQDAQAKSKSECKPILILFQEVPGCQTCRTYGTGVLSHPLIMEAIETYFIPLAIYNNKSGHDGEVLKRYNEPAWNNPVVRIVDEKGNDVAGRLNGNYSAHGLAEIMTNTLIKLNGKSPVFLQLLTDELAAQKRGPSTAVYSMYCFWTGEALFGEVNGVVKTTAGWADGREVVKVEYDPNIITKSQLDKISERNSCKPMSANSVRPDATPKYYLFNHKYKAIPMTEIQKCRVNSALADHQRADIFLSPRQLDVLQMKNQKNFVSVEFEEAWDLVYGKAE